MANIEFLEKINLKNKHIIDYANLINQDLLNQKIFLTKRDLLIFLKKIYLGLPIIFPTKLKEFYDFILRSAKNNQQKINTDELNTSINSKSIESS